MRIRASEGLLATNIVGGTMVRKGLIKAAVASGCVAAVLFLELASRANAAGPCPAMKEPAVAPGSYTWYVQAGAPFSADGGYLSPFNNLAQVHAASNPGDTIIIVSVSTSVPPLDGGIVLQAGQTLAGGNGPGVPGVAPCSNVLQASSTPPLLFPLPDFPIITTLPTTVPTSSGLSSLPRITMQAQRGTLERETRSPWQTTRR